MSSDTSMVRVTPVETEARVAGVETGATLSDSELIAAIGSGDRAALKSVYDDHSPPIYTLARRMCGPTLARHIIESVFVELWRRPGRFRPDKESFGRFLRRETQRRAVYLLLDFGALSLP